MCSPSSKLAGEHFCRATASGWKVESLDGWKLIGGVRVRPKTCSVISVEVYVRHKLTRFNFQKKPIVFCNVCTYTDNVTDNIVIPLKMSCDIYVGLMRGKKK